MEFIESLQLLNLQSDLHINSHYYSEGASHDNHNNIQPEHFYHSVVKVRGKNSFRNNHSINPNILSSSYEDFAEAGTAGGGLSVDEKLILAATDELPTMSVTPTTAILGDYDDLQLRLPTWGIVILVTAYLLVFLFGVVGNCSVLIVVVRLRRMKTVTNYFIFSLATADLLVLFFCLLPNLASNVFVPWILGWFLCKTVPYIQGVSVCASIYFLVAISVERCVAIRWPFNYQITKEKAKFIIAAIWLWALLVALPWALFFQEGAFDPDYPNTTFCIEVWPEGYETWSTYYFIFGNFVICYLLPLGVILVCYLTIWLRVYRRPVPSNCYQTAMELVHQRSKTAVIKMLFIVVLIFALSWLPLYALIIRLKFGGEPSDTESVVITVVYPVAQWLGCFNSCINPIIYSFLNQKFRKAFLSICGCNRKKNIIKVKHKSPTVNLLLKRLSTIQYRVETTMYDDKEDSSDSI